MSERTNWKKEAVKDFENMCKRVNLVDHTAVVVDSNTTEYKRGDTVVDMSGTAWFVRHAISACSPSHTWYEYYEVEQPFTVAYLMRYNDRLEVLESRPWKLR